MIILPAIDIINGQAVRLYQGDYNKVDQVAKSILDTAKSFETGGAQFVHMVDLDGAKAGHPMNQDIILETANTISIPVEVGGGIRSMEQISSYLDHGVSRVILGTAAVQDETLLKDALQKYREKIAVGIDAKDGLVRTAGWLSNAELDYISFAKKMADLGVKTAIVTDISKDGTLQGPNFSMYEMLQKEVDMQLVASGGMHAMEDIERLADMDLYGAIIGKAIYSGAIPLEKAIAAGGK